MTNMVRIEVADASGSWIQVTRVPAEPAYNIRNQLKQALKSRTAQMVNSNSRLGKVGARARAVDERTGALVDMEFE